MFEEHERRGDKMPLKERARAFVDGGFEGTPDQFLKEATTIIRALLRRHPGETT